MHSVQALSDSSWRRCELLVGEGRRLQLLAGLLARVDAPPMVDRGRRRWMVWLVVSIPIHARRSPLHAPPNLGVGNREDGVESGIWGRESNYFSFVYQNFIKNIFFFFFCFLKKKKDFSSFSVTEDRPPKSEYALLCFSVTIRLCF